MGSSPHRWDRTTLAAAYDRYGGNVYGLAFAITGRPDVAGTLTQQVFAEVAAGAPHDVERRLLSGIHRLAVAWARHAQVPPANPDLTTGNQTPLAQLPPAERAAIRDAYFGGRTYGEIAAGMHLGNGQVAQLLRSGLLRLSDPAQDAGVRSQPDVRAI